MRSIVWVESFKGGPWHKWEVYSGMELNEKLCVGMWIRFSRLSLGVSGGVV